MLYLQYLTISVLRGIFLFSRKWGGKIKSPMFWRERPCILGWKSLAEVLSCCFFCLVWKYVVGILFYSIWGIYLNFQETYSSAENKKLCVSGYIPEGKSQMLYWILDKNTRQEWGWCWRMDFVCKSSIRGCWWRCLNVGPCPLGCGDTSTDTVQHTGFSSAIFLWFGPSESCVSSSAFPAHWLLQKCPWSLLQNSMLPLENLYSHDENPMSGFAM